MSLGTVIGVDPGVRKVAAVVSLPGSNLTWTHTVGQEILRPGACHEILWNAMRFFGNFADEFRDEPVAVYIEEPVVGVNRRISVQQGQIHGVLLGAALQSGITQVYSVSNTTWKKETIGSGNASKDDCRTWLERSHPVLAADCGGDADLVDAGCIAVYGRGVLARAGQFAHRVPGTG